MDVNKPKHVKASVWKQHLKWMEITDAECRANRLKRKQAPHKDGRQTHY